ncbi:MAG: FprA family A-type flavoprotein [Ruminococcaceae bacterium]|nr:FprA family A-type flavoprotein [Oscillospiraceae bacterium]
MTITEDIKYIGVYDKKTDLFEGQYIIPEGISYNSYIIIDEKIAVMDTVEKGFKEEWLLNLEIALNGRFPDYLVVTHMEPDHSANILSFINKYPNVKIVASAKAFAMMKNFYGDVFEDFKYVVGDGDLLKLGKHSLTFYTAPMVHWPEVIVAYDNFDKVLFSADGFGKFGEKVTGDDWACEARRYYFGIVGKYGAQVQALLKKAATLEINKICPLHGPVLCENLSYYINLYDIWSSYGTETDGIVIAYTSVYGNTKKAAELLKEELEKKGKKVALNDLARCDMAEAVEDSFRYGTTVFATTTYNAEIFPFMREFINELTERNFQNKTVAFIENGSWAPCAAKVMKELLSKSKNLTFAQTEIKIMSALSDENKKQIILLAEEIGG